MFKEMSFEEWAAKVTEAFASQGLALPEEEELLILSHMECMEEKKSIDDFVEEEKKNQGK